MNNNKVFHIHFFKVLFKENTHHSQINIYRLKIRRKIKPGHTNYFTGNKENTSYLNL